MLADLRAMGRTGLAALDARLAALGATDIRPVFDPGLNAAEKAARGMNRIFAVRYASGVDPETAAGSLAGLAGLAYAEPNGFYHAMLAPNDTYYPNQWAHNNTGQAVSYSGGYVGTPDCDNDTDQAWDLQTGSSALTLAIIDTGVDLGHPEFAGRIVAGYDFVNNDSDPTDDGNHGTCCAGIAVGAGNNAQGIAGVAWNVKLMPIKVLNSSGSGSYTGVANGITWAADHGAKVLSLSLGGSASSTVETALNYAYGLGCAVFCAAGNSNRSNLDYPAAYANAIAVGALSPCNERKSTTSCDGEYWWGSNYGTGLDFLAPGTRIHTTDRRGSAGYGSGDYITDFNGTSAATPHAAGIGALVWSQNPSLTSAQLLSVLQTNCDDLGSAGYDTQTGYGRMNAYRAVQNAGGGGGPTPVTLFSEGFETTVVPGTIWSATDANGTSGLDYWGDQSSGSGARVHGGSYSAYCADNSSVSGQRYDNNMNADMTLINAVAVGGYTNVQLSFWTWYRTSNSSDYLSLQYRNGSAWVEQQRWFGAGTTWTQWTYTLTGFTTFKLRFIFYSNGTQTREGAYIDDVGIVGTPSGFAPSGPMAMALVSEEREVPTPSADRADRPRAEIAFTWPGVGDRVPSGVYYARFSTADGPAVSRPLIVVR
jgi:subtilisin family serine protease